MFYFCFAGPIYVAYRLPHFQQKFGDATFSGPVDRIPTHQPHGIFQYQKGDWPVHFQIKSDPGRGGGGDKMKSDPFLEMNQGVLNGSFHHLSAGFESCWCVNVCSRSFWGIFDRKRWFSKDVKGKLGGIRHKKLPDMSHFQQQESPESGIIAWNKWWVFEASI